MSKRKPLSSSTRFEVFKRDSFTCQYCGRKAPEIILNVDHIEPVSKGGPASTFNLITSCQECNGGKGARLLSDSQVIDKQFAQLEEINERRKQLEMLCRWREELAHYKDLEAKAVTDTFTKRTGYNVAETARDMVKSWIARFGMHEVLESLDASLSHYLKDNSQESVEKCWLMIPRIAGCRRKWGTSPVIQRIIYLRAILCNRLPYVPPDVVEILKDLVDAGTDVEDLIRISKASTSWTNFKNRLVKLHEGGGM